MSQEVFKIWNNDHCYFIITDFAPDERKASIIMGSWSGFVDQFRNGESLEEIKQTAKSWLRDKLSKPFDNQYSSKKQFEYLLKELEKETEEQQLTLF